MNLSTTLIAALAALSLSAQAAPPAKPQPAPRAQFIAPPPGQVTNTQNKPPQPAMPLLKPRAACFHNAKSPNSHEPGCVLPE